MENWECGGYTNRWIYQPIVLFKHANPTILKVVTEYNDTILVKLAIQNRDVQIYIFLVSS